MLRLWVHVQYSPARETYYRRLFRYLGPVLGGVEQCIVVENSLKHTRGRRDVICGTNSYREFSGWAEGLRPNLVSIGKNDWILFSNDTFAHHRFFWGSLAFGFVNAIRRERKALQPTIVGDVVPGNLFSADGRRGYNYVSTYLFAANAAALGVLGFDFVEGSPLDWVKVAPDFKLTGSNCPDKIRVALENHLSCPESKAAWRGAAIPSPSNISVLRSKARAVIMEHFFSHRAEMLGVRLVPIVNRTSINLLRAIRSLEARLLSR